MDNICPYWKLENDGCHPVICDRCFHPDVKLWGEQRPYIQKAVAPAKRIKLKQIITTTNVDGTHSYIIIK
jgi:hypothetical protein